MLPQLYLGNAPSSQRIDENANNTTSPARNWPLGLVIGGESYRGKSHQANALFAFPVAAAIGQDGGAGLRRSEVVMSDIVNVRAPSVRILTVSLLAAASVFGSQVAPAAKPKELPPVPRPSYARVADLVTASQAIAVISVKKMTAIPAAEAPGLPAGYQRFLIAADTQSLIRGNDVLNKEASFLIDLALPPKAKPPKWAKRNFLIFGRVEDRVDFFQLLASDSLIAWSPDNEAFVRKVDKEMTAGDAPPLIRGVDSVFHVAGTVAGEGESQIFLTTSDGSPISLSIIRKPGEQPLFGVSLGEIVDEAAALPGNDTPLWYRLACFLPAQIPEKALAGQAAPDAAAASKDYADFLKAMAPCDRAPQPVE